MQRDKELLAPQSAWQVTLDEDNSLQWRSYERTTGQQPAHSFGQRIADFFTASCRKNSCSHHRHLTY